MVARSVGDSDGEVGGVRRVQPLLGARHLSDALAKLTFQSFWSISTQLDRQMLRKVQLQRARHALAELLQRERGPAPVP